MEQNSGIKIIKLQAENVKRLKAVEITPSGDLVVISGKNGMGKTSVLDSIMYALGGQATMPSMTVRKGEEKANVTLDMGEFVVKRTIQANGNTYLKITSKDGKTYDTPQKMLDKLVGSLSFDPLDFIKMKSEQQLTLLKDVLKIDFTGLEQRYKETFENRTILNREKISLKNRIDSIPKPATDAGIPETETSLADLTNAYKAALTEKQANEDKKKELIQLRGMVQVVDENKKKCLTDIADIKVEIANLETEMLEKQNEIKKLDTEHANLVERGKKTRAEVDKLVDPDIAGIQDKMNRVEETNALVRQNKTVTELQASYSEIEGKIDTATKTLELINQDKLDQIKAANLPVPYLSFNEKEVLFKDVPFVQLSASEQLKISLVLGLALNPKIRVILIRDGSLLDSENMAVIGKIAQKYDSQIWIERVDESGEMGVVIEDGMVKEGKPNA